MHRFQRMILHLAARSGMHFHLREAGLPQLCWTQGAISATSTAVGVVHKKTKGPLQRALMGGNFPLFFYPMSFFKKLSRITMATMYYQHTCPKNALFKKKKSKLPSLSIKGHIRSLFK
jgi:hypothetical protein